jgi:hypothetical protein
MGRSVRTACRSISPFEVHTFARQFFEEDGQSRIPEHAAHRSSVADRQPTASHTQRPDADGNRYEGKPVARDGRAQSVAGQCPNCRRLRGWRRRLRMRLGLKTRTYPRFTAPPPTPCLRIRQHPPAPQSANRYRRQHPPSPRTGAQASREMSRALRTRGDW